MSSRYVPSPSFNILESNSLNGMHKRFLWLCRICPWISKLYTTNITIYWKVYSSKIHFFFTITSISHHKYTSIGLVLHTEMNTALFRSNLVCYWLNNTRGMKQKPFKMADIFTFSIRLKTISIGLNMSAIYQILWSRIWNGKISQRFLTITKLVLYFV